MAVQEWGDELGSMVSKLAWSANYSAGHLLREQLGILEHFERHGLDETTRAKAKACGIEYALLGGLPSLVRSVDSMLYKENTKLLLTVQEKIGLIELKERKQERPAESFARERMRRGQGSPKPQDRTAAGRRKAAV